MAVVWSYRAGDAEKGRSPAFPDRESAERWLGEAWSELADDGVEEVELVAADGEVLYRMGLGPA
jgi:hypothetical protein